MIERQTEMETGREKGVWTQVWDEAATGTLPCLLPYLKVVPTYYLSTYCHVMVEFWGSELGQDVWAKER